MANITDPQSQSSYDYGTPQIDTVTEASLGSTDFNQRILPRQLSTGSLRGTQTVGYGAVKIDGSNDRITIGSVTNSLGEQAQTTIGKLSDAPGDESFGLKVVDDSGNTVQFGLMSDGTPGMEIIDSSGFVLFKLTGKTWYWYDKNYNTNTMQAGLLPDGNYGWVTTPPADNVSSAFST